MLEVIDKGSRSEAHPAPLLFVHGGYHAAWCWDVHFLNYFADKGFRAVAVSLRGHGQSVRSQPLASCSIADYIDDVRIVADTLDSEPVLVGHSMGGFVVQRYLEKIHAPAAVLMASMPPQGVLRVTLGTLRRHPWAFLRANTFGNPAELMNTPDRAREFLFSADTPESIVESCAARLDPESRRAGIGGDVRRVLLQTLSALKQFSAFAGRYGELPDLVRGYEQIKLDNIERMGGWAAELAAQLEATRLPAEPVA